MQDVSCSDIGERAKKKRKKRKKKAGQEAPISSPDGQMPIAP